MRHLAPLALTLSGLMAVPPQAAAPALLCAPREAVVASLSGRYDERRLGSGLESESRLIEIWRSDATGTWTVLLTRPDGISCILASGTHWSEAAPESGGVSREAAVRHGP